VFLRNIFVDVRECGGSISTETSGAYLTEHTISCVRITKGSLTRQTGTDYVAVIVFLCSQGIVCLLV
jgi:hypothetical protein